MKKQRRGTGSIFRRGGVLWVQYYRNGKRYRESAQSNREVDARKLLSKRLGQIALGSFIGPQSERVTLNQLTDDLLAEYKMNKKRSLGRLQDSINHLIGYFSDDKAVTIMTDRVRNYIMFRQEQGAANATINRELSALKRSFNLALESSPPKIHACPYIPMLEERNVRKGFFEADQLQSVLKYLPEDLRVPTETAYITGWRIHDEILTRQRHHIDFKAGWIRLEPGETKNDEGRMFPLTPRLREILQAQIERTEALQREKGRMIPWLFHRKGKPIRTFRRAWISACVKAGLGTEVRDIKGKLVKKIASRILHDFRRTAVRNLERAGVPRSTAMKMVGHRTESIYRRYAIVDEAMLREGGQKLAALNDAQAILEQQEKSV